MADGERYRISVRGRVPPEWADRLGGLEPASRLDGAGRTVTIMEGPLRDQAALSGVLNTLYNLHLTVISVENLSDPESEVEFEPKPVAPDL